MSVATTRLLVAGAAALLTLGLSGCSSDSTSSSQTESATTAAASPAASTGAVCVDVDASQAALQDVVNTRILQDGTDALKENFAAFEASVQTLVDSARTDFAAEADAVRSSVDALKAAINGLTDSPSVADAAAVAAAIKPVQESLSALVTAVKGAC